MSTRQKSPFHHWNRVKFRALGNATRRDSSRGTLEARNGPTSTVSQTANTARQTNTQKKGLWLKIMTANVSGAINNARRSKAGKATEANWMRRGAEDC